MKTLKRWARKLRAFSAKTGFSCEGCGAEIFDYPIKRFCADCEERLCKNDKHFCARCGRKTWSEGICLSCKSVVPRFDKGCAPFVYQGEVASHINRMKNGGLRLVYFFAEEMVKCALNNGLGEGRYALNEETALIIPVPLTKERERERGYNQAVELAFAVRDCLQKQGVRIEVYEEVLIKTRESAPQKDLSFGLRQENAQGAYRVKNRVICRDKMILLVDDIMTTGATGSECARVLKNAGASAVYFLSCASLAETR